HSVSIDSLHLSHLVWCQVQLLGQKLYLIPSPPTGSATMVWGVLSRRWRSGILCPRLQHTYRRTDHRQSNYLQHQTSKHRHPHRVSLSSIISPESWSPVASL